MTRSTTPTESGNAAKTSTKSGAKPESSSDPTLLQSEGDSIDLSPQALLVQRVTKRENVRQKGARLLVSGRLRVVRVDGEVVVAECRGDSGGVLPPRPRPRKGSSLAVYLRGPNRLLPPSRAMGGDSS